MRPKSTTLKPYLACSADFEAGASADLPAWINLLPKDALKTVDGRLAGKTLSLKDLKLCSFDGLDPIDKVPIDINHGIAKAAGNGSETPAVGWLVELQVRDTGLWGRPEWGPRGREAVTNKEYRGISVELMVNQADGTIAGIRGASLTNRPNVKGLVPIFNNAEDNQEEDDMEKFLPMLCSALAIAVITDESKVLEAVKALKAKADAGDAQLMSVAEAAGLAKDAKPEAVLLAVTEKFKAVVPGDDKAITELQAELQTTTNAFNDFKSKALKKDAEGFLDGEIKKGRVGVKALRDKYITRMMSSEKAFDEVKAEVELMPLLAAGSVIDAAAAPKAGEVLMTADDNAVARALNIPVEEYKKTKVAIAANEEAA